MSATGNIGRGFTQQGFTLIEALVVVAIVGLLAGLVAPRIQSMISGQEFRTARSQFILSVREARALAIRSSDPSRFSIVNNGRGFQLERDEPEILPEAVSLSSQGKSDSVVFYPDGTSNGALFTLTGRNQREQFVIFPTTGIIAEVQ